MSAREEILQRVRTALGPDTDQRPVTVPRDYRHAGGRVDDALIELLTDRLEDYRAEVVLSGAGDQAIAATIAGVLRDRALRSVVAPPAVARTWLAEPPVEVIADDGDLAPTELDRIDAVVSGATVAVAETGMIVLDGSDLCGRRAITLVPDVHLCVVRRDQVVCSVPEAIASLDPRRPLTMIAGPSATSDIELDRVEGVHGPRTLIVILAG